MLDSRFAQGQTTAAKTAIITIRGIEKRKIGPIKLVMLKPLVNQTIISESLYQRTKTIKTAINKETVRRIAKYPKVANAMRTRASSGFTTPFAAKPKIRITNVVIMMVTSTKNTAPVVILSSRRRACSKIMSSIVYLGGNNSLGG